ncbi:MAG: transglycosylase domain-containing protein, partial [Chloroflexota bacterium]
MPDEPQNRPEDYDYNGDANNETDRYPQDDDVPFHLPMAEDDDYAGPDEDTDDFPAVTAPSDGIIRPAGSAERDAHNMPTMPIPREPGMRDPKQTVKNPKFNANETMRHKVPRPEDMSYTQPSQVQSPIARPAQQPRRQQPAPDVRYQRPQNYPTPANAPKAGYPVPPAGAGGRPPTPGKGTRSRSAGNGNGSARRPRRRGRLIGCLPNGCLFIGGGIFLTFCGGLTLLFLIGLGVANARVSPIIEEGVASIQDYDAFESTFYYDRDGRLLYEDFNEGRRVFTPLNEFPQDLIDATIALEDDTFYTNPGIEVSATMRATLQYLDLLEGDSGGSTITQQLVRNIAFDYEKRTTRSVARKAEEILLAIAITGRLSKDEILELYLNEVYYGNLAYGAQAASQTIFGKDVGDLTLGEAALLAGLPQAPAELDPLNPDPNVQQAVLNRWRQALDAMVRERIITQEERNQTLQAGLNVFTPDAPLNAPHFTVYAQDELEVLLTGLGYNPEQVAGGGFRVYTTVNLNLNNEVQNAVREQLAQLR